jgi:hypothetical protein
MQRHFIEPEPMKLQGGAIFDSRVKDWIDTIFEKDLASGTVIVHQERLVLPAGIESYSSPEESRLRNDVYNINALLTSFRMRQLCTLESVVGGESLLHAHAELFLSRGYAAWNLTGKSRIDFENSLKRLTDPTLTMLFTGNAPVCSVENNEILDSSDLREHVLQLQRENANFKAISEQAAEEMAILRDKLMSKEEQIQLMEINLGESIQAALSAKEKELESLRSSTDLIVASALQEQKDFRREQAEKDPARIASLEAYVKTLEKERAQLEHYLRIARDALLLKKYERRTDLSGPPSRDTEGVVFETRIPPASENDDESYPYQTDDASLYSSKESQVKQAKQEKPQALKKRPEKGCIVM